MSRIRLGIDVGGTFTKAVAVDITNAQLIGKSAVHTTHFSNRGVAEGIIQALTKVINQNNIKVSEIELISHSTTQAVNALLEADTSKVGIIGMGVALEKSNIIKRTKINDLELASGKYLSSCYRFLDTSKYLDEKEVKEKIEELKQEGADVLVVSEAYGVDDPSNESYVLKNSDIPSTAGHELTGIYGLEIRTLTAAINACILPKAINTAKFVEDAVRNEGITCPIMIMKGDGGITDINTFKQKPILTVLSGPAASVAGALLHSKVLNGVFIEVGGTSTNICVIKNGKPEIKYVTITKHPTCIRSVDVRIAGVAGGSLIRISNKKIIDVGPRSAHIAGLQYSCFVNPEVIKDGKIERFRPKENDPDDYICIRTQNNQRIAITTTCAANALGLVSDKEYSFGNQESARMAISMLAKEIGLTFFDTAETILTNATKKIMEIIERMIKDYGLKNDQIMLIGGGGGAASIIPYIAKKNNFKFKIADHAEVISSIGVSAAMVYEEKEKTVDKPTPEDISELIEEIKINALNRGALPESLSIQTEFISERSILRATAMGNVELDIGKSSINEITLKEAEKIAIDVINSENINNISDMRNYYVFNGEVIKKRLLSNKKKYPLLVLDKFGKIRLMLENAKIVKGDVNRIVSDLESEILYYSKKNKDGLAPQIHILDDIKLIDFSSLTSPEHVITAIKDEIRKSNTAELTAIIKLS